jgi:hypothetical protein
LRFTGNRTKDSLIAKDLAFFDPVTTPTGRVKILSLTTKGVALLPQEEARTRYRRGGATHEYWRHQLKLMLEQHGYAVQEEFPVGGGHTVDLHASKGARRLSIEIETGKSDVMGNIEKCQGLPGQTYFFFTASELKPNYEHTLRDVLGAIAVTPSDLETFRSQL